MDSWSDPKPNKEPTPQHVAQVAFPLTKILEISMSSIIKPERRKSQPYMNLGLPAIFSMMTVLKCKVVSLAF